MKANIMLIDDNKIDLFVNQKIIDKTGLEATVKSFINGNTAMAFLKTLNDENNCQITFRPNLILLDINMAEMNGFEFLKEFEKLHNIKENNIKIYMLSSSSNSQDIELAKTQKSCMGFVNKPLTVDKLNEIITCFKPYLKEYDYLNEDIQMEIFNRTA